MARRTCSQGMAGHLCKNGVCNRWGCKKRASLLERRLGRYSKTTRPQLSGLVDGITHSLVGEFVFQVVNVHTTLAEPFVTNQVAVQRDIGLDPVHHDFVQGVAHARQGFVTVLAVGDQLADQRVIVRRYRITTVQVRIDANAVAAWSVEVLDGARARNELLRVLGVDPALQGVTADHHVVLGVGQRVAGGDAEHLLDDVDAGDHFRYRVFHLHASVHLDEVEVAVLVEELEGAGATVVDVDARLDAAGEDFLAGFFIDARGRCFFQYLLVAALQRAVAVTQVNGVALAVGQHLDFHVARVGKEFFQIHHRVAERRASFGAGQFGRGDQVFFLVHHAHAATTTATGGLDDHRVADFTADAQGFFLVFRQWAVGTGNGRYTGFDHGVLGRNLVAHQANGVGLRADEGETGFLDLFGEVGVFREEAVARVDRRGTGHFRGRDDGRDVQVGLGGRRRADAHGFVRQAQVHQLLVGIGVDGDGLDPQFLAGAQDPQCNFTAVGDQDYFQLRRIRHRWLSALQTMVNSGWSYSTGWPSSTRIDSITPLVSASMWFIIFMASTMHRVSPFFTLWPTSTKDGAAGEDLR